MLDDLFSFSLVMFPLIVGISYLIYHRSKKSAQSDVAKKKREEIEEVSPRTRSCDYCDENFMIPSEEYQNHLRAQHPDQWRKIESVNKILQQQKKMGEDGTLQLLESALMTLTIGVSSIEELVDDTIWGIFDPLYGIYKKTKLQTMTPQTARETIKNIYLKYREYTETYLDIVADRLDKYRKGAQVRLLLESLKKEQETEDDVLKILKIRYAKGEITREQYEEMKKTLGYQ